MERQYCKEKQRERHVHHVKMLVERHLVDLGGALVVALEAFSKAANGAKLERAWVVEHHVQEATDKIGHEQGERKEQGSAAQRRRCMRERPD